MYIIFWIRINLALLLVHVLVLEYDCFLKSSQVFLEVSDFLTYTSNVHVEKETLGKQYSHPHCRWATRDEENLFNNYTVQF